MTRAPSGKGPEATPEAGNIPAYLVEPPKQAAHFYGKLVYEEKEKTWEINGEPAVAEMAKRLFPGSSGRGAGHARFPATKRAAGDLNWLMLRFPLHVEQPERFAEVRQEAIRFVQTRVHLNEARPRRSEPAEFAGQLLKFQQEGLAYLINNERCLLADEQGLGKTPTAIAWLGSIKRWPALIVVQPHMVRQWKREIRRFLPNAIISTASGMKPHSITFRYGWDDPWANEEVAGEVPRIFIVHYLLLTAWQQELEAAGFESMVFDEVQELRHSGTKKYSAASMLSGSMEHVAGLSGTPIYNAGAEIWNVLNIVDYHCLGDWEAFTREWCTGYGNLTVEKPGLLGEYLRREGLMLRRLKADVLKELPEKRRVVQTIDADQQTYRNGIVEAVKLAGMARATKNPLEKGRFTEEAINVTRRVTGLAKAPFVAAFVRALVAGGERVILFAHHHSVWDRYRADLKDLKVVWHTGRESTADKDKAVEAFQKGDAQVIAVALRSSTGINLQRGNCVVFGELDWSPGVHAQAEDRAHRMGQKDSVLAYYLTTELGSDPEVIDALGLKTSQFQGIMGDRAETERDRMLAQQAVRAQMARIIDKLHGKVEPPLETTSGEAEAWVDWESTPQPGQRTLRIDR